MAEDSKIQWTHHTLNPWSGCAKAHTGCLNCYAEHSPPSMRRGAKWGTAAQGATRVPASAEYMRQPLKWARAAAKAGERHRVFCGSMMDVLEVPEVAPPPRHGAMGQMVGGGRADMMLEVMDAQRAKLWDIIRQTAHMPVPSDEEEPASVHAGFPPTRTSPGLDYLLLTKRPENWRLVPEDVRPLVWLGTSISNQETADEWVPRLLEAEGFRYRFLSVEPLVGPVDLNRACWGESKPRPSLYTQARMVCRPGHPGWRDGFHPLRAIDWVIVGLESGIHARELPDAEQAVADILRQCREAEVPCFVTQMGRRWAEARGLKKWNPTRQMHVPDTHGGDPLTWPEDLRVQEFPHG